MIRSPHQLLLCLFLTGLLSCLTAGQELNQAVKLNDVRLYQFDVATLKTDSNRVLELDLPGELKMLLSEKQIEWLQLESKTSLRELGDELEKECKVFQQDFAGDRSDKARREWEKLTRSFSDRLMRKLSADEKQLVQDAVDATEFFELGFDGFVKKHVGDTPTDAAPDFLKGRSEQIRKELQEIEQNVLDLLLEGTDDDKTTELSFFLRDPARLPPLSLLAKSLIEIKQTALPRLRQEKKLYQYRVSLGQFEEYRSFPPNQMVLLQAMSAAAKTSRNSAAVRETIMELFERKQELEEEFLHKQREINLDFEDAQERRTAIEKLVKDELAAQEELEKSVLEKLDTPIRREIGRARIAADYCQFGLATALFNKQNKGEFEFPLDADDYQRFARKAEAAHDLLQELTNKWIQEIFRKPLEEKLKSSKHLHWVKRGNQRGVFPVEIVFLWSLR